MPTLTTEHIEAYLKLGESLEAHGITLDELTALTSAPFEARMGVKMKELALEAIAAQHQAFPLFNPTLVEELPLNMRSIDDLYLGSELNRRLRRGNVTTFEELMAHTAGELLALRGMDAKDVEAIIGRLKARGFALKDEAADR